MTIKGLLGRIAKPSAHEDFAVMQTAEGGTPEIERHVRGLIQIHQQTDAVHTEFLFVRAGIQWFAVAESEPGIDAAGRPRFRAEFGRLNGTSAGTGEMPPFVRRWLEAETEAPSPSDPDSPAARLALAGLLLDRPIVAVSDLRDALWIIRRWGPDPGLTVMSTNGRLPWDQSGGRLLVVTPQPWQTLSTVRELSELIGARDLPNISALRGLDTERRTALVRAWVNGNLSYAQLQEDEADWLLSSPDHRDQVLATSGQTRLRRWMVEGLLTPKEILQFRTIWTSSDSPGLAAALKDSPEGLEVLLKCIGPAPAQVRSFLALGDTRMPAFEWVLNGCPADSAVSEEGVLSLVSTGAFDGIGLAEANRLAQTLPRIAVLDLWNRIWTETGRAGLPGSQYSTFGAEWLTGGIRQGKIDASDGLKTLAHWRGDDHCVPATIAARVLSACGFNHACELADLMDGRLSFERAADCGVDSGTVRKLISCCLLKPDTMAAEILRGAPIKLLRDLVHPSAYALLTDGSPPQEAPSDWPEWLTCLLSQQVERAEFWRRWGTLGIPPKLLDWMARTLAQSVGGTLVANLAAVLENRTVKLSVPDLSIVGAALPQSAKVWLAAAWATSKDWKAAFEALSVPHATSALNWLALRRATWNYLAPPVDLTADEMLALLPWLDGLWVVHTVMAREHVEADEFRLIGPVCEALLRGQDQPLAVPPSEVAARRPDWVRSLSQLPQWGEWRDASICAGGR